MATGLYNQLGETWKNQDVKRTRELTLKWRKENSVNKVERPTRLDKARMLGYKAKKGFVIARVKVNRGGRKRKRHTIRKVVKMSYRWVAEQRAQKKFQNLEVLNSYFLAKDGENYFYEIIMVDYSRPEIKNDKTINWITKKTNQHRVHRGLTSAGKKSRGMRPKSPSNKNRPSVRRGHGRGK